MSSPDLNVEREAISVEHFAKAGPDVNAPFATEEFWLFSYADGSDEIVFDPCEAQHKIEHMRVCF